MYEEEIEDYKFAESSDPRLDLLDGLIRLLEVRVEELERRISLIGEASR
jgi:hypothetical protein